MKSFRAEIPERQIRRVPVVVGEGALDLLVRELVERSVRGVVAVVSDSNVAPLHGAPFVTALATAGVRAQLLTFPAGELSKTRATKERLEDELLALGAGRDAVVVAVGGGVTGDLAGFVASTFLRGIPVWQAPTTTLAMADAALGGKTAVDVAVGKNLIGTFHHPEGIYADLITLRTLPEEIYRAGFAEVVKTAVIADAALFDRVERDAARLLARDAAALESVLFACLELKARVVAEDERESGLRMILNFGHTIAHALEVASGFALAHGQAVAIGLCVEARIARALTGFPPRDVARLESLIRTLGLPVRPPAAIATGAILDATRRDKKARGGRTRYALPVALGTMPGGSGSAIEVDPAIVTEALRGD